MDPLLAVCMAGAIACISFGTARLISFAHRRRDYETARVIREAALIAQAHAEVTHG